MVQVLFVLLQIMYVGFHAGALANLAEINELFAPLPFAAPLFTVMIVTAALMIPVRAFLASAGIFTLRGSGENFVRSGRFYCCWTGCGRWRLSCFCTTSVTDWRWLARRCWSIRLLRNAR